MQMRNGDWLQTFTGRQFWPVDPKPEEVCLDDIAHALAMQCRFAGHCQRFYSVAEHSVHVSYLVPDADALWALLHDASEAYLVDVPRPLKPFLPGYREAEDAVMLAVCTRYGLDPIMPASVKEMDRRMLAREAQVNMSSPPAPWSNPAEPAPVDLSFYDPSTAETVFLRRFKVLWNVHRAQVREVCQRSAQELQALRNSRLMAEMGDDMAYTNGTIDRIDLRIAEAQRQHDAALRVAEWVSTEEPQRCEDTEPL